MTSVILSARKIRQLNSGKNLQLDDYDSICNNINQSSNIMIVDIYIFVVVMYSLYLYQNLEIGSILYMVVLQSFVILTIDLMRVVMLFTNLYFQIIESNFPVYLIAWVIGFGVYLQLGMISSIWIHFLLSILSGLYIKLWNVFPENEHYQCVKHVIPGFGVPYLVFAYATLFLNGIDPFIDTLIDTTLVHIFGCIMITSLTSTAVLTKNIVKFIDDE